MRILVTGGLSEIGLAIVRRRIQFGDEVAVTSSRLNVQTPDDLKQIKIFPFRLENPDLDSSLKSWIDSGIDGLVLNAATHNKSLRRLHEYLPEEIQEPFDINVLGNLNLLRQILPKMVEKNFGRIVYISSIAVLGASRYGLYAATKSAIEAALRGVANDYGEFNITANSLRPGVVETERTKRFWKRSSYREVMAPTIPLTRFCNPEDIAVASDPLLALKTAITGTEIDVSGGLPQFRTEALFKVGL